MILKGWSLTVLAAYEGLLKCAVDYPGLLQDIFDFLRKSESMHLSSIWTQSKRLFAKVVSCRSRCTIWRETYIATSQQGVPDGSKYISYANPVYAYFDAVILMLLIASNSTIALVTGQLEQTISISPELRLCLSTPDSANLLSDIKSYATTMKWAYTVASCSASAPLRLLDLAMEGICDVVKYLPEDVKDIVFDARLSEEQRMDLIGCGIPTPPLTPGASA